MSKIVAAFLKPCAKIINMQAKKDCENDGGKWKNDNCEFSESGGMSVRFLS